MYAWCKTLILHVYAYDKKRCTLCPFIIFLSGSVLETTHDLCKPYHAANILLTNTI